MSTRAIYTGRRGAERAGFIHRSVSAASAPRLDVRGVSSVFDLARAEALPLADPHGWWPDSSTSEGKTLIGPIDI
jgi:hypothetical protein